MYLLFVDESGTHPGPHPFVLGAMAIHEDDAARLQKELDQVVIEKLGRVPSNLDVMLKMLRTQQDLPNRGLVIHDRRVVAERDIQGWTAAWRSTAERIGQLRNLADVPLFGDSRATRLLQVADVISYAVFRRYNRQALNTDYFDKIWPAFHAVGETIHGVVHYTSSYGDGSCDCEPCQQRLLAEAAKSARPKKPKP